ncbi:hypothetical protein P7H00_12630 [Enterococcus pseudoavium]|uniref:Uncharacterized protein n=1 Tax=Enterococcus pseudoavium TaxID=44007 RepID=A0AAE4L2J7_9ENTE|nr:hypothetical protein [Enterococcus pseudoavium]MDT2737956.1 hypothetical protein [Enterococcus pseudoavium]
MNYSKRCKITINTTQPGYLGEDEVISETKIVPCSQSLLSASDQVNIFGKYTKSAFELHLQGNYDQIDEIEYEGVRRSIFDVRFHRNSTVVIVS